jgi:hypothetical protein
MVISAPKLMVLGYLPNDTSELFIGAINAQLKQSSSYSSSF